MRKEELKAMLRQVTPEEPSFDFRDRVMGRVRILPSHGVRDSVVLFYGLACFFICMGFAMEFGLRLAGLGGMSQFWLRMQPQFILLNGVWLVIAGVILNMEGYRALNAAVVAILAHAVLLSGTAGVIIALSKFFIVPGLFVLILCLGTSLLLMSRHPVRGCIYDKCFLGDRHRSGG